jgi:hypothetical protein
MQARTVAALGLEYQLVLMKWAPMRFEERPRSFRRLLA